MARGPAVAVDDGRRRRLVGWFSMVHVQSSRPVGLRAISMRARSRVRVRQIALVHASIRLSWNSGCKRTLASTIRLRTRPKLLGGLSGQGISNTDL